MTRHTIVGSSGLALCNCDGSWHVECPDGITRYISRESVNDLVRESIIEALTITPKNMSEWQLDSNKAVKHATSSHADYTIDNRQAFSFVKRLLPFRRERLLNGGGDG